LSQAWWYAPIILALWRLRQEARKFKANLGYLVRPYIVRPCLKTNKQTKNLKVSESNICPIWEIANQGKYEPA
jgi:hypothetical protein